MPLDAVTNSTGASPLTGLIIAGVTPFSTVDWPGKLVASVFLQGCPWNCGYCQNFAIIDPRTPAGYEEADLWELLGRRCGLLDGVVFSGGEPTRQSALVPAARRVRDLGFLAGLHTAGAYPQRLRDLLETGLLNWIGLDIKALPEDYPHVVGRSGANGEAAWSALDAVLSAAHQGIVGDYEVRVTVYPGRDASDTNPAKAVKIARKLKEKGVKTLAVQQARPDGTRAQFAQAYALDQTFRSRLDTAVEAIAALGFPNFIDRT